MSVQTSHEDYSLTFTEEKIALIKNTICRSCSNDELELFVMTCKRLKLDPFMKQIYAIKRGNVMSIQTGIDGYRLIAERSGRYMPGKEPTFIYDDGKRLFSATSYVKKLGADGQWHEIASTAVYSEYAGSTPIWKQMPHVMLAKCAESAALRRAFPAELSGVYTSEEMEQADVQDIKHLNESTGEIVQKLSPDQIKEIMALVQGDKDFIKNVCAYYKVSNLLQIEASNFETIYQRAKLKSVHIMEAELGNVVPQDEMAVL